MDSLDPDTIGNSAMNAGLSGNHMAPDSAFQIAGVPNRGKKSSAMLLPAQQDFRKNRLIRPDFLR
jgi:hypothetical protein